LHDADRAAGEPLISTLVPPFSWPRMFSTGTSTLSNTSSPVCEPRMPSLSSFCATEKPFMPFSTMNAVMPRAPSSGSVFA